MVSAPSDGGRAALDDRGRAPRRTADRGPAEWRGRAAARRSSRARSRPATAAAATSSQLTTMPCWWNSGAISQNRSTGARAGSSAATLTSSVRLALHLPRQQQDERHDEVERRSASAPTTRQPVCSRCRYQAISSGRLPDQMIRYCENEKYAHSITNASIRLPRSWKCAGDDDAVERRPAAEPDEHDDQERQRRQSLAADDQHAVDRREPVRLERHQPVERREGDGQAVGEQAAAAQHLHPPRDARIAGAVLFERPGVQEVRRARSRPAK